MCPVDFDTGSGIAKNVAGIDIGSTFSKAVVVSENSIRSWAVIASGGDYCGR